MAEILLSTTLFAGQALTAAPSPSNSVRVCLLPSNVRVAIVAGGKSTACLLALIEDRTWFIAIQFCLARSHYA